MRHIEKKYRQHKANELKHNELGRLHKLQCELVTRTKTLYYKKKLDECVNDSNFFFQTNSLLGKNKKSKFLPSGKLPH